MAELRDRYDREIERLYAIIKCQQEINGKITSGRDQALKECRRLEDERDQALSDCNQQSLEISRLEEENSTILKKMICYRQYVEMGIHREIMASKENEMFKHLEADLQNTNSTRVLRQHKQRRRALCPLDGNVRTPHHHKNEAMRRLSFNPLASFSEETLGETNIRVTNESQQFVWKDYGLTLDIEAESLPTTLQECQICIKALTPSSVQSCIPYDVSLCSAIYWFQCEPDCCFVKAITMRMQHCSKSEDKSRLCILRADYHPIENESVHIEFEKLRGDFSENGIGAIRVNGFSLYGAGDEGSDEKEYYATIAHHYDQRLADIHFVLTMNTPPFLTHIKEIYGDQIKLQFSIVLEREKVNLMFSKEAKNGWRIRPMFNPVIRKREVDNYSIGKGIPACMLRACVLNTDDLPDLEAIINLEGASGDRTFFEVHVRALDVLPKNSDALGECSGSRPKRNRADTEDEPGQPVKRLRTHSMDSGTSSITPLSQSGTLTSSQGESSDDSSTSPISRSAKPELREILMKLYPVAAKWENIGIFVGIKPNILESIKKDNSSSQEDCLREMLKVWEKQVNPPPTWSAMADALCIIGENEFARNLRDH